VYVSRHANTAVALLDPFGGHLAPLRDALFSAIAPVTVNEQRTSQTARLGRLGNAHIITHHHRDIMTRRARALSGKAKFKSPV
jgi:hypothetical protein